MKTKLKGAIIPYVVTVLWMIFGLIFYDFYGNGLFITTICQFCFSVPWLFISLYSLFNKEDNSTQKYLIALSLLAVVECYLICGGGYSESHPFLSFLNNFSVLICLFLIFTFLCIGLIKLYYIIDKDKKSPFIKYLMILILSCIGLVGMAMASGGYYPSILVMWFFSTFVLFGLQALFIEYKRDEKNKVIKSFFSGYGFLSIFTIITSLIRGVIFGPYFEYDTLYSTIIDITNALYGIIFLIGYEFGGEKENSLLKYIMAILLCPFLDNEYGMFGSEVLSSLIAFIPIIVCFISELSGKSITAAIANAIKKQDDGSCGEVVHPEKSSELRRRARGQLGGRIFDTAWLMMVLVLIIYGAISGFAAMTLIGGLLVGGPLSYGLTRVQARLVNESGYEVDLSDLFKGFSESFTQSLVLGFMQTLFTALWSVLFVVPGIVKTYAYSMAFYIQQQSDDKNWKKALDQSRRLMRGNKMKLFLLDLSFIGWYILGGMCFGIGVLFVYPYHMTARANFFDSLLKNSLAAAEETVATEPEEAVSTELDECGCIEETAATSADVNA